MRGLGALLRGLTEGRFPSGLDSLEMPSRCILAINVVLDRPSLAAAPFQPPMTQCDSRSVSKMWSRSTSASVLDTCTSST
jgi:hypothetical protein